MEVVRHEYPGDQAGVSPESRLNEHATGETTEPEVLEQPASTLGNCRQEVDLALDRDASRSQAVAVPDSQHWCRVGWERAPAYRWGALLGVGEMRYQSGRG